MRAQSVLAVNAMIGALQAAVAAIGQEKNTYFIFSSDKGYHVGEHRLMPGKMTAYDTDIHVPLVEPDPSIQGRSAEKTPRAPQRMMPAIKTTRATFIRRVRPTGFPPLGPSPARTTPTTRSTVSPSQAKEFIGTPYAASSPVARSTSRAYRAIQTFPESTFVA
jgi:hypothetical protein